MDSGRETRPQAPRVHQLPALVETRRFDGSDVASPRRARRFVRECLERAAASAPWAMVLTGELATNVIRHTDSDFDVVVRIDDTTLRVEIRDGHAATDAFRELVARPPTSVPASSPSGRGWSLIAATAARFGLDDPPGGGKSVWFELELDR